MVAVDCSQLAVANGKRAFPHEQIDWVISDATAFLEGSAHFDVIVRYGLLGCLPTVEAIQNLIRLALSRTSPGGYHIVAAFNDGPHDLRAHPNFLPTLAPHRFFVKEDRCTELLHQSDSILHEIIFIMACRTSTVSPD